MDGDTLLSTAMVIMIAKGVVYSAFICYLAYWVCGIVRGKDTLHEQTTEKEADQ